MKTEDALTLEFMHQLAGTARVKKLTISKNHAQGADKEHNASSESISESREHVLDAQLLRSLSPHEGVAILTLDNHSMDDVVRLMSVYL